MTDREILRDLAQRYAELAADPVMDERRRLHCAVNDNHMIRPVVLLEELPWHELNVDGSLTLQCSDPWLRQVEQYMRRTLFRHRYFPADSIVRPTLPVEKVIHSSGNGIVVREEVKESDLRSNIVSHEYEDQFAQDEDLEKLHMETITYDSAETERRRRMLEEMVGDIVPVALKGVSWFPVVTWDDISMYRGVTPILYDLVDRPEFSHALVEMLTRIQLDKLRQYEELGLLDDEPDELHCTSARTSDLPKAQPGEKVTRRNIWGRGAAQVFATVGKAMHDEYDIDYMIRTIGTCGLSYYGCCEPLDKKIDIVSRIPNLRKISITPWADVDVAAEAIEGRYVVASKPNPAAVAVDNLDVPALRSEIGRILNACSRNGCSCDLVLKDISTCKYNLQNIVQWEKTVMEMVRG